MASSGLFVELSRYRFKTEKTSNLGVPTEFEVFSLMKHESKKYNKILAKYGFELSPEELMLAMSSVRQLSRCIIEFEKKRKQKLQTKVMK